MRNELAEDPHDPFALWVLHLVQATPVHDSAFFTVYLILHGILNLGLVLALLARFSWAFPASIAALFLFIVYQMYKYALDGSPTMLLLTAIDIAVIWLIWREFKSVRAHAA